LLSGLPDKAFFIVDQLMTGFFLARKTVTGHPLEAAVVFAHIHGGNHSTQVLGEKLQDIAPQHIERQATQYLLRQLGLAVAQPGLLLQALRSLHFQLEVVPVTL